MNRLLVLLTVLTTTAADFNDTKCPAYWEVRSPHVADSFDMNKFVGTYYEQALHDITQYPTCPKLSCIRSVKTWTDTNGGDYQIQDDFSIECFGHTYSTECVKQRSFCRVWPSSTHHARHVFDLRYYFNTTDENGYLVGFLLGTSLRAPLPRPTVICSI